MANKLLKASRGSDGLSSGGGYRVKAFLLMMLPVALILQANCANAQDRVKTVERTSLSVILNGSISSDCGMGGGGLLPLGELTGNDYVSAPFNLNCNVPFELIFNSASGGLVHEDKPMGEGPFKGTLPYQLEVTVPAASPDPVGLLGRFDSATMVAGATLSSGEAIASAPGRIILRGQLGEGDELLAGRYKDSIRITIIPRI